MYIYTHYIYIPIIYTYPYIYIYIYRCIHTWEGVIAEVGTCRVLQKRRDEVGAVEDVRGDDGVNKRVGRLV